MADNPLERRLAAILAADVAGYSKLMGSDEQGTLSRFARLRSDLIDPKIQQFKGRVVGSAGDSLLVEFSSVVDAVQCAVELQARMQEQMKEWPAEQHIVFRMGINLGEIISDGTTIHGDAVNVAARLEKIAQPGGVVVARVVHDQIKAKLPYAILDLGLHEAKNIAEPIHAFRVTAREGGDASLPGQPHLQPPQKPSIAVLPFTNMSSDSEQEYFSDGITEDIITELSRNRNLFVIARNSSFVFKGKSWDVAEVGRRLGVRYVLEGSVRRLGSRIRVTAQLIEATSGSHVWAERYDRLLSDLFDVQDEVTEQIVWALSGHVGLAEMQRLNHRTRTNLDAYDLTLQGVSAFHRFTENDTRIAVEHFGKAVELDSRSAIAWAWFAQALSYLATFEGNSDLRERALVAAERSMELGDSNGLAESVVVADSRSGGNLEQAAAYLERAVALGPTNPHVLAWVGFFRLWEGRLNEAREVGERLRRLDPLDPGWVHELLACTYYLQGEYVLSLEAFHRWRNNDHYRSFANLAACLAQLDRLDEARQAWATCLSLKSGFCVDDYARDSPYRREEDRAHWLAGLAKAGIM